jgi:hypothetical protein
MLGKCSFLYFVQWGTSIGVVARAACIQGQVGCILGNLLHCSEAKPHAQFVVFSWAPFSELGCGSFVSSCSCFIC